VVSPYPAGTRTLQEAPSFAWRTTGMLLSGREAKAFWSAGAAELGVGHKHAVAAIVDLP
jgi:hypothetical protein